MQEILHAWALRPELGPAVAALMRGEKITADVQAQLAGARTQEPVLSSGVAIIPLKGLITPQGSLFSILFGFGGGLAGFRASLREALSDSDVSTIVLDVDSPGGLIDLVPEAAAEIREADKPIVAVASTDAASAAYWLASQADELVVTPSGRVGSVGVYMIHEDWSKWNERMGVEPTYISAGKFKTDGNPDEPLSDSARAAFQKEVEHYYGMFVGDVAAGRGVSEASVRDGFGEGRMATAEDAVALGMADRVATFEETVAELVATGGRPSLSARATRVALQSAASTEPAEGEPEEPDGEPVEEAAEEAEETLADDTAETDDTDEPEDETETPSPDARRVLFDVLT